jgi:hypothetical protein
MNTIARSLALLIMGGALVVGLSPVTTVFAQSNPTTIPLGVSNKMLLEQVGHWQKPVTFRTLRAGVDGIELESTPHELLGLTGTYKVSLTKDSLVRQVVFVAKDVRREAYERAGKLLTSSLKSTELSAPENGADVQEWTADGVRTVLMLVDEKTLSLTATQFDAQK